jgi:hypothetical protein
MEPIKENMPTEHQNLLKSAANRLSRLSGPIRIIVVVGAVLVATIALFWLFNELFYYLVAKSYADELSQAYNLNRGFTKALIWASFAAIAILAGCTFSFSKSRRTIGYIGILALLIGHGVLIGKRDQYYDLSGKTEKCYVLRRDGITILNHVGIDPDTGRECKLLTPQMTEKYNAYKDGKRPQRVTENNTAFFDPVSGEPVIWFAKGDAGRIELFDLMGFHPQTGEELKPVDRQIVDDWRKQSSTVVKRVPNRIVDPDKYGFFDPLSGNSKVWFWLSEAGEYEFYDGPGFHPASGDALKITSRDSIASWRQALQVAAERSRKEQERRAQLARDEMAAKQAELEAKGLADRQAAEEAQKQLQSGDDCDRLAANPTDAQRKADGITFDALRSQADSAFDACIKATRQFPSELRYQYQLGRAAQFKDKKKAFEIFTGLTNSGYAAAFDNLGGMYQDKNDIGTAAQLFQRGAKLGDADSMVSLAALIEKGYLAPPDASNVRLALLKRAGELGHAGAQRAFEIEYEKAQTSQQQQAMQLQVQKQMIDIFGAVVQRAIRR